MSKKHYVAIAAIFADQLAQMEPVDEPDFFYDGSAFDALKAAAERLADYFKQDNPAFDRARFLAACGVTD